MAHRLVGVALAAGLAALVACTGSSEQSDVTVEPPTDEAVTLRPPTSVTPPTTDATTDGTDGAADTGEAGGDPLTVGALLPATGDHSYLGPATFAAARLAATEIDDAGGVLGEQVLLIEADSGGTAEPIVERSAAALLADGVDVIVGAMSSALTLDIVEPVTTAGVVLFSPASTSPTLSEVADDGLFFRTAPSDVLQGRLVGNLLSDEGAGAVLIIARDDAYGAPLAAAISATLDAGGATTGEAGRVTTLTYEVGEATEVSEEELDRVADLAAEHDPDAIVVIGFEESAQLLADLIARDLGPSTRTVLGVDANAGNALGDRFDDNGALEGLRGTFLSARPSESFVERLTAANPGLDDLRYAPEAYDAVVISALAAEAAGTTDPVALAAEIVGVTRDGVRCTTFAECRDLLAAGDDIDYDGEGGPYSFDEGGEPTAATYAVVTFGADNRIDDELTTHRFVE
ncbi:MAG: ABC transporter substrate-binding protein [Actinomycetota bacterium]|nr:ABC transporter substrate-binding protein [Actinomycetota bacterium]